MVFALRRAVQEESGIYAPRTDPAAAVVLAREHIATCQEAQRRCLVLVQAAASVAHDAVQADVLDDCEAASVLYRKATVLLEQAVEEVASQQP